MELLAWNLMTGPSAKNTGSFCRESACLGVVVRECTVSLQKSLAVFRSDRGRAYESLACGHTKGGRSTWPGIGCSSRDPCPLSSGKAERCHVCHLLVIVIQRLCWYHLVLRTTCTSRRIFFIPQIFDVIYVARLSYPLYLWGRQKRRPNASRSPS